MDDLHSHPLTRRPFFPAQHALALCGSLCTRFIMPIESKASTSQSDALPTLTETHSAAQIVCFLLSLSISRVKFMLMQHFALIKAHSTWPCALVR